MSKEARIVNEFKPYLRHGDCKTEALRERAIVNDGCQPGNEEFLAFSLRRV